MQAVANDRAHAFFTIRCTSNTTHWLDFSH